MATFQENLSHNLAEFGWKVAPGDIPAYEVVARQIDTLHTWWYKAPQEVRTVIAHADLADALWGAGMLSEWPALHGLLKGNPFGTFTGSINDVQTIVERSHNAVTE
jgi:hypothetical protein